MLEEDHVRGGRQQVQNRLAGGLAKRGAVHRTHRGQKRDRPSNEALCAEVLALRRGVRNWTPSCAIVADRHGMSGRQVQRITEPIKW
jgi:hypothetical protein